MHPVSLDPDRIDLWRAPAMRRRVATHSHCVVAYRVPVLDDVATGFRDGTIDCHYEGTEPDQSTVLRCESGMPIVKHEYHLNNHHVPITKRDYHL